MSTNLPVLLKDKTYVPTTLLEDPDLTRTKYNVHAFDTNFCLTSKCSFLDERGFKNPRPTENCFGCDGYHGRFKLTRDVHVNGVDFIGLPRGATNWAEYTNTNYLGSTNRVIDLRPKQVFINKIVFYEEKLHDYQVEAIDTCSFSTGVLKSAARTGKTVMATAIIVKNGLKTLILAAQQEWLDNFYETLVYDEDKTDFPWTNIHELGKNVCGFAKKLEDFYKYDICLATTQTFISEVGKAKFKEIKDLFGTVIVDECFTGDHYIKTNFGFVQMNDLKSLANKNVLVESYNHELKITEYKPLNNIWETESITDEMIVITIDDAEFICTPDHLWWCTNRNEYVEASELTELDDVLTNL